LAETLLQHETVESPENNVTKHAATSHIKIDKPHQNYMSSRYLNIIYFDKKV